ncbi:tRNA lysidine(34) synthetase TilS [Pseudochryseolinea flava]|uniref:tRNA(Ile)-lysidine synthase n=1 Tax=Pseudochryseolinea flava TaxID=2059302 RepID=A0A364Y5E0_9BACT|nr:tRNA lysidine(34) synthetase TilS [Pseudochryseolinea flava]RAW01037.1 tRNA lysidine(34) synthetase TilS [Pseudochryseolinea flava]
MLKQFLNHLSNFQISESGKTLLAVSGGMDSMTMLHLYTAASLPIGVAHCNFKLRGHEADADAMLVKTTCEQLNIPFHIREFDTQNYAWENGLSIQMAARELRYAWFDQLMDDFHYHQVATAHHLNDTIETVIMNWIHGGSLESFAGIPVKQNRIVRPMLFATRAEIESYSEAHKIVWREDQSNLSDDYTRNFLRHQVLPKLKEVNPSLEQTIRRGLHKIAGETELLSMGLSQWQSRYLVRKEERVVIDKHGFEQLHHPDAILWKCIRPLGFNLDMCTEIMQAMKGQSGKIFFTGSHQLVIDRDALIVTPRPLNWEPVEVAAGQSKVTIGKLSMEVSVPGSASTTKTPHEVTMDASEVTFPMTWRKWKAGDFFYPLGMEHRKKISDFLIDMKVSRADKDNVTVLECDGKIAWVVGYRLDNRFKVKAETSEVISFSVHPHFS